MVTERTYVKPVSMYAEINNNKAQKKDSPKSADKSARCDKICTDTLKKNELIENTNKDLERKLKESNVAKTNLRGIIAELCDKTPNKTDKLCKGEPTVNPKQNGTTTANYEYQVEEENPYGFYSPFADETQSENPTYVQNTQRNKLEETVYSVLQPEEGANVELPEKGPQGTVRRNPDPNEKTTTNPGDVDLTLFQAASAAGKKRRTMKKNKNKKSVKKNKNKRKATMKKDLRKKRTSNKKK